MLKKGNAVSEWRNWKTRWVVKLTRNQIDDILDELHLAIQFYDEHGKRANGFVLMLIKGVLVSKFLGKWGKDKSE